MPETFLILWAGGIMLAAAVPEPRGVTLNWLRLAGILALSMVGLSLFFYSRHDAAGGTSPWAVPVAFGWTAAAVFGQLAFVQVARRRVQRALALAAAAGAAVVAVTLFPRGGPWAHVSAGWRAMVPVVSALGVEAMTGLALMDMLLGHAYLTASRMTMRPFRRLNIALGVALAVRIVSAVGVVVVLWPRCPVEMLWGRYGLYIMTRWGVGLAVPALFVYMAGDCIRRRANQSATGILYVAGVLIFIGELIALSLVRETALPF